MGRASTGATTAASLAKNVQQAKAKAARQADQVAKAEQVLKTEKQRKDEREERLRQRQAMVSNNAPALEFIMFAEEKELAHFTAIANGLLQVHFPTSTYQLSKTVVKSMDPNMITNMQAVGLDTAPVQQATAKQLKIMTVQQAATDAGCKLRTLRDHVNNKTINMIPNIELMKSVDQRNELVGFLLRRATIMTGNNSVLSAAESDLTLQWVIERGNDRDPVEMPELRLFISEIRDNRERARALSAGRDYVDKKMVSEKVAKRWMNKNGLELKDASDHELRRTRAESDIPRAQRFFDD